MRLFLATAGLGLLAACAVESGAPATPTPTPTAPAAVATFPVGPLHALAGEASGPSYLFEPRGELFDPRLAAAPVLDPDRKRVLMFGGWSGGSVRTDSIEYDGVGWQRRVPTGQPGARFGAGTVYDTRLHRTLMFGGFNSTSPTIALADNATWEWRGAEWSQLAIDAPPPARGGATLAQDQNTYDIYTFGGSVLVDGATITNDDLYRFDGTQWSKVEKPAGQPWPAARASSAMAWDPATRTILLFGGFGRFNADTQGNPAIGEPFYDTWSWNGSTWTELQMQSAPSGQVVSGSDGSLIPLAGRQTLLVDPKTNTLVMVHEGLAGLELWRFDPTIPTWTATVQPRPNDGGPNFRLLANAFIDPSDGSIVVNGGLGTGVPRGTTEIQLAAALADGKDVSDYFSGDMTNEEWIFDGTSWLQRTVPGDPGPRLETSAAYDEERHVAVMFGGRFGSATTLGDTWIWDGGHWTEVTGAGSPPARRGHSLAFDPVRHAVVMYGGIDADGTTLDDAWTWTGSWSQVPVGTGPGPRDHHLLLRDQSGLLLYGGLRPDGSHANDTWRLQGNAWTLLPDSGTNGSYDVGGASDAVIGTWLFGGVRVQDGQGTDDFRHFVTTSGIWDGINAPDGTLDLQERRECSLFADGARQQVLLADGLGAGIDTAWNRFDIATGVWTSMLPRPYDRLMDPPRRVSSAAYFFDPTVGVATYFGGRALGIETTTSETWRLRQVGDACTEGSTCANGNTCVDGVCCESAACGPCESCAVAGNRGICTARGVVESTDGCPAAQGLSCTTDGRCRAGDGATCTLDPQCASGTCIGGTCCSAEGCVQRCENDSTQRNPNGTETQCGTFLCRGSACLTSCATAADCASGNVCTSDNKCVAANNASGEAPGGCSASGTSRSAPWALAFLALLFVRRRGLRA